jgi:hypothetical protein
MDPTVAETVPKRADKLVVGDRIPNEQTAFPFNKGEATVVFVADEPDKNESHTFVAYRYPNGRHDSMTVRSEAELQVFPAADPTGLAYSRADDGETTQPIAGRTPPHVGAVTDAGLVDETGDCHHGCASLGVSPDCGVHGGVSRGRS